MVDSGMIWTYGLLTVQAIAPIILGSFKSLKTPASVRARRKARKSPSAIPSGDSDTEDEDDLDADAELDETLTWGDTLLFPVMGSVALLGFYMVLKYVGKEWINLILGVYFSGAGMFAMHSTFDTLISFFLRTVGIKPAKYHFRVSSKLRQVFHASFTLPSLLLIPLSIALPALYIPLGRPYVLSNLIALSLSTATLQLLKLDSFLTAGVLLGALLVYDIFWVFATPVMVTVAKGLDAPIKLLAPRPSTGTVTDFAMLGLGDVVVPGLMVALCLRFDLAQYARRHPGKDVGPRSSFSRPYFWTGVFSYLLGLAITMSVMTYFKRAQPALLYLSPACILGPFLLALVRGEIADLWAYKEGAEDSKSIVDETIERGSEIAQKARAEARAKAAALADGVSGGEGEDKASGAEGEEQDGAVEGDDSWMEGGVAGSGQEGKARKRRTKKK
ncbi:putative minor histocompatibility antigen h13 [Dioszegia hungarica]|uniref:Minor histocompatibility antigen h13 n=1 Tax=Dioszegia hungarica TaxID=4972 RepID=A0AA38H2Q6_9TREE|nr:putative minor histocompatibility antigen h13 [Dioszegia hungarica]KAI9632812.1 putative minor histocompatibility antigen h13 [Dioszegia hungarica]